MKKLIKFTFATALFAIAITACDTAPSIDDVNVEEETTDKVVRKKPGRS